MSKYGTLRKDMPRKSNEPHPIWRGIGCFIMLILPPMAYALAALTVEAATKRGIILPEGLGGYPVMPDLLFRVPGLVGVLYWIQGQYNLYAILLVSFFMLVFLAGVVSLFYSIMYRVTGPSQYSGFDVPPPKAKIRKYKR